MVNQKVYWGVIGGVTVVAVGIGVIGSMTAAPNPINQPLIIQQSIRASGFTIKAEATLRKDVKTGKPQVDARMFATGPMHDEEVIRMEGEFSLITTDGRVQSFGPSSWTFAQNLTASLPLPDPILGAKVKVSGRIYDYHREDIKVEREILPDGSVRLYMNTGTVTFRKVPNSNPAKVEIECLDLESVHQHGIELMAPDKKTVSGRIMLTAGKQQIERENLPFGHGKPGMEPLVIRQLIPWRDEPVELVVSVQDAK